MPGWRKVGKFSAIADLWLQSVFFSEDVERECSVVREKERKMMLEEETGSEGEAGPVLSVKYTNMFTQFS